MSTKASVPAALLALAAMTGAARADVVFQNSFSNGYFTPFNSANATTVKYGDGGWLSGSGTATYTLTHITLGMASDGVGAGSGVMHFTFNDGDPSGLVFGPGTQLYSTDVPVSFDDGTNFFSVDIDLPNIVTSGGFNNIGWSVGFTSFSFNGEVGFQCSTAGGQSIGFYTSNASYYDGSSWSLFSFGSNSNTGVANFRASILGGVTQVPAPGVFGAAGMSGLLVLRRKR